MDEIIIMAQKKMKHSIKIWEAVDFKKKHSQKETKIFLTHLSQTQEDTSAGHLFDVHSTARP